jgi:hypothetical protein
MKFLSVAFAVAVLLVSAGWAGNPANPILFVTQVPMPEEVNSRTVTQAYMSCVSPFANHLADTGHAGRGGSLWIRFSSGQVVDLLAAADWSAVAASRPAANTVAVRNPSVHWLGDRAIFSMVIGAPTGPADPTVFIWQLFEITLPTQAQLNASVKPVLTKVASQPAYNNIFPCYALNGKIVFSSDRPYNGQAHLTQREEYLGLETVSGLWSLDPSNAASLQLLHHSPSGAFSPNVDSSGRLIFTNWDHLARDSEAVTDSRPPMTGSPYSETFLQTTNGSGNFADESAAAGFTKVINMAPNSWDIFPEPRSFDHKTLIDDFGGKINGNAFNIFMPWMINLDGTNGELLNHVGRHEVTAGAGKSFTTDSNVVDVSANAAPGYGGLGVHTYFVNLMWTREDPLNKGVYYGCDAGDLGTHGAGQIIKLGNAGLDAFGNPVNPDTMTVTYATGGSNGKAKPALIPTVRPGRNIATTGASPLTAANAEALYRTPLPCKDGALVASYAAGVTQTDWDNGTYSGNAGTPASFLTFRVISLKSAAGNGTPPMIPDVTLTGANGLTLNTSYYVGSTLITYSGPAWELDPAEVVSRTAPATALTSSIDPIEAGVFASNGVDIPTFQNYLVQHGAALSVSRNVTRRDIHDRQQPFNLKVAWSSTQATGNGTSGTVYSIAWSQFFQADLRRGYTFGSGNAPAAGRRVVATAMHDTMAENVATPGAPPGAVRIGDDGSVAAVVPAGKALTWHLVDNDAALTSQVKERFWVTFQKGEIRTCANCHGINTSDQTGTIASPVTKPTNPPQALAALLQQWKTQHPYGSIRHAAPSLSALKTTGSVAVKVQRTGGSTGIVSVNYATANSTAAAGVDYTAKSGTLTWADGDTADKTITISLLNPATIGPSKAFTVSLSSPALGSLAAPSSATVTVDEPPFAAWQYARFGANANVASVAGPNVDFDHDGFENLIEYAGNTNPNSSASTAPATVFAEVDAIDGKTYLTMTYTRRLPPRDVTYHVETSIDLAAWSEAAVDIAELSATDDGNAVTETVKARAKAAVAPGLPRFLRLRVTQP